MQLLEDMKLFVYEGLNCGKEKAFIWVWVSKNNHELSNNFIKKMISTTYLMIMILSLNSKVRVIWQDGSNNPN